MPTVTPRHDVDAALLEERLYDFNAEAVGRRDGEDLGFVVEEAGELIAACAGYTWAGIAEVKQMWVRPDRRGEGLGRAVMQAAIDEARARGAKLMFLSTHSFQAPGFYEGLGFECVATIADKPLGHAEHWMRLRL